MRKHQLDLLPDEVVRQAEKFVAANPGTKSIEEMEASEFLAAFFGWNGLVGYAPSVISVMEKLGWTYREPPERFMEDAEREVVLEELQQQSYSMNRDDCKAAAESAAEYELTGTVGLVNVSDRALIDELKSYYVNKDDDLLPLDEDGEGNLLYWIVVKYGFPEHYSGQLTTPEPAESTQPPS